MANETIKQSVPLELCTSATTLAPPARRLEWVRWLNHWIPLLYLTIALPSTILLSLWVPPMQVMDEGRHFLRAYQFSEGHLLSDIGAARNTAGGWVPVAVADFVRTAMSPEFLRAQGRLASVDARFEALDHTAQAEPSLNQREFVAFPESTIYPPAMYFPQVLGIWAARMFSDKVYIWFYAARLSNAICSVLIVCLALLLAPSQRFLLLLPAIIPMSLYEMASIASDAGIISVSILFVALSLRFIGRDGRWLRVALAFVLLLLVVAKPVYIPFSVLLLAAHCRLGGRRALSFFALVLVIAGGSYLLWVRLVSSFIPFAGRDFPGHDPSAQFHFLLLHPVEMTMILVYSLSTLRGSVLTGLGGTLGWLELPLPPWTYRFGVGMVAVLLVVAAANWKRGRASKLALALTSGAAITFAILLGAFVLWTPVGSNHAAKIQGRYLIPAFAVIAFLIPPVSKLRRTSQFALAAVSLGSLVVLSVATLTAVRHYYFQKSPLLGKNLRHVFIVDRSQFCPASVRGDIDGMFSMVFTGTSRFRGGFQVAIADQKGTIVGVSDPALVGSNFPYFLFPGSSRSDWRVHLWTFMKPTELRYWLITGKRVCNFGRPIEVEPVHIPAA